MAVAKSLSRLLDVLEIEEEQAKRAFQAAMVEYRQLERRMSAALHSEKSGRQLVSASAVNNSLTDRLAGLEQSKLSARHAAELKSRMERAAKLVAENRELYLGKRIERRQAETLIDEARAAAQVEAGRRGQQVLDDWYLNRLHRNDLKDQSDTKREKRIADGSSPGENHS
jgi:flagellar biosynthesis chaperone FliJ